MRVWVIMGNDYPDAVFASEEAANAYVETKKAEPASQGQFSPRIYWRAYDFQLQGEDNGPSAQD